MRGSRSQCHVEEDLSGGRCKAASAVLVDEDADLLIAWPTEPEMACQSRDAPVDLRDWQCIVVEPLDRGEKRRSDPRSCCGHSSTVADVLSRHDHGTVPIHRQVTVCYLASVVEPSSPIVQPGLWATSQGCPSGSTKTPE